MMTLLLRLAQLSLLLLPLWADEHRNIIHIIVDDLRTELNSYQETTSANKIFSPSIDSLAGAGVVFDRAYANQALCNPSRASFLTGRRPDTTRIWNLEDNWRLQHQDWTSLPGMFKDAGFLSLGVGKTYHDTVQKDFKDAIFEYDGKRSWSEEALPYRNPCWTQGVDCVPCKTGWKENNVSADWCIHPNGDLSDVLTIDRAIDYLSLAASSSRPFYLAVGLHKPHMPWIFKQEHYDLYPNVTVSRSPTLHSSVPPIAFHARGEQEGLYDSLPDEQAAIARRAYFAATTGMDEQVGRLLAALEVSGKASSTAVLLHGDHGWHLGEKGQWYKSSQWEAGLKTPFILKVPWLEGLAGKRTQHIAELVDVMPTLAELAGVPFPPVGRLGDRREPPEGKSLVGALVEAATGGAGDGEKSADEGVAFSVCPRCPESEDELWKQNDCGHDDAKSFKYMGYSVRVANWRYTEWRTWNGTLLQADWSEPCPLTMTELYDHSEELAITDYDSTEIVNVAADEQNAGVIETLAKLLRNEMAPVTLLQ